jgi:ketosteroid isomerase-like protein
MFHPDVEILPLRAAAGGTYQGFAGVEAFIADTFEVFDTFEVRWEYTAIGDRVLGSGTVHLRAKASGIEMDWESCGVFEFRDGRIVRLRNYESKAEALEALGGSE